MSASGSRADSSLAERLGESDGRLMVALRERDEARKECDQLRSKLEDHSPEGHNVANKDYADLLIKCDQLSEQRDEALAMQQRERRMNERLQEERDQLRAEVGRLQALNTELAAAIKWAKQLLMVRKKVREWTRKEAK